MEAEEDCEDGRKFERPGGGRLYRVLLFFRPERCREAVSLAIRLEADGLRVERAALRSFRPEENGTGTLALTDDEQLAFWLQKSGIICFGCVFPQQGGQESGRWFRSVPLVLEDSEEIDARYLEEWFLRVQGLPAEIASAGPVTLREISAEDEAELIRIAAEPEVRPCVRDGSFTTEWLTAYREQAYRIQGYGLWSVLFGERVIGCCGFAPWDTVREEEERRAGRTIFARSLSPVLEYQTFPDSRHYPEAVLPPDFRSDVCLELQYFLDAGYRKRGLGFEMCRAALNYARERLGIEAFRIVIPPENTASRALAIRLGFVEL